MADTYIYNNFGDFLYGYFRQLHLNSMPAEKKAKFAELKEKKRLTKAQDNWVIGNGDENLPNISNLEPEQVENLYRRILGALRGMDDNHQDIGRKNPKLTSVLDKFFGESMPFDKFHPDEAVQKKAKDLGRFLTENSRTPVASFILTNCFNDKEYNLKKFMDDLDRNNYGEAFIDRVNYIMRSVSNWFFQLGDTDKNSKEINEFLNTFNELENGLDQSKEDLGRPESKRKIEMFKQPEVYRQIFQAVYGDEKFRQEFEKSSAGRKITDELDKAKENANYDKLSTKMDDKPTWLQQKKDAFDKAIGGTVGKLTDRHKKHNYVTAAAQSIVEAIREAKIEPKDGLEKVLEKANDIKERLEGESPAAVGAWDTFADVMGKIGKGMPKAFAGCLKNGAQMRAVVQQVIAMCLETGKFDEAKAIMETLSVLMYGSLTSDVWEEWKKNDIKLWDGVTGMDKGFLKWFATGTNFAVNRGVNALFWAGQITVNKIRLGGARFGNDEDLGALKKPLEYYRTHDDPDHIETYRKKEEAAGRRMTPEVEANIDGEISNAMSNKTAKEAEVKTAERKEKRFEYLKEKSKLELESAYEEMRKEEENQRKAYEAFKKDKSDNILMRETHVADYMVKKAKEKLEKAEKKAEIAERVHNNKLNDAEKRKEELEKAAELADNPHELMNDLIAQRKAAGRGTPEARELARKIVTFKKKFRYEAAAENLRNKENRPGFDSNEKTKYQQAVELMDFWDFMQTKTVEDTNILHHHKNVQKDFTERMNSRNSPFAMFMRQQEEGRAA
ncbi:MAG: hypothetical protein LBT45_01125 [Rickettsiales bacterium]|jgi:hypothetical protein|nr:hypothetical protein [Rickettsiales bacterium]